MLHNRQRDEILLSRFLYYIIPNQTCFQRQNIASFLNSQLTCIVPSLFSAVKARPIKSCYHSSTIVICLLICCNWNLEKNSIILFTVNLNPIQRNSNDIVVFAQQLLSRAIFNFIHHLASQSSI